MTQIAYFALLLSIAVQRLMELRHSRRNAEAVRKVGAVELGAGHYPWMVALHTAFLVSCAAEVWLLGRPFIPPLAAVALALLAAATVLRYLAIKTLGPRWTTRVFLWPGRPLIDHGPYRLIRHPNYVAVAVEIAVLPLVHTAWITAIVFSLLNGWLLTVRVRVEGRALDQAGTNSERALATD